MAQYWTAKAPSEVIEREWVVPVPEHDSLASFTATVTGAVKDAESLAGDTVTLTFSAGTAGAAATVDLTATTAKGVVLAETYYLPIRISDAALGNTARDVCDFALRKVTGTEDEAEAAELADALERLSDMLAMWSGQGADLKARLPVEASDTLFVPDAHIAAIKYNLILNLADQYSFEPSARIYSMALTGLAQIKNALLPKERAGAEFY